MNTFFSSLASGLGIPGANPEKIMPYVPAIVVTLYDGYYIYSPSETVYYGSYLKSNGKLEDEVTTTGYTHLLKPYIYYSAKYVKGSDYVVVNYSLDSYISIYGRINNEVISKSGYLYSKKFDNIYNEEYLTEDIKFGVDVEVTLPTGEKQKQVQIETRNNCQYIYSNLSNKDNSAQKVYLIDGTWCILNGLDKVPVDINNSVDNSAKKYVEESKKFTDWVNGNDKLLEIVTSRNAVYQTIDNSRKLSRTSI